MMIPVILVLFFLPEMLIRKKAVKAEQTEKEKTVTLEREKEVVGIIFPKRGGKGNQGVQTGNWLIELWREKSVHLLFREWRIKKTAIDRLMWAQLCVS